MFKKFIILWLLFIFVAVTPVYSVSPAISVTVMGGSSSTCDTSNVVLWWRAEALDFSGTNGTTDYTSNDDTWSVNNGLAVHSSAAKYGTYGLDVNSSWKYGYLDPGNPTTMDEEGKFGSWVRIQTFLNGFILAQVYWDNSNKFGFALAGTDELEFRWRDNNTARTTLTTTSANLTTGTWYWIEAAWKTSTSYREIWVDGVSQASTTTGPMNDFSSASFYRLYLGDAAVGSTVDIHMDNIIMSTDSTVDLHTDCKDELEWPE